jgi:large subunit ribosomal protein L21
VVAGAVVEAEVVEHGRGEKVRIVKHKRRKHYHKEQGHRQWYTLFLLCPTKFCNWWRCVVL